MPAQSHASLSQRAMTYGLRTFTALVLVYLIVPVLIVLPLSFSSGQVLAFPMPGLSLQWYRDFFTNPLWTGALANSVIIAVITTTIATLMGTLAAIGLHNSRFRLKSLVMGILVL